MSQIKALRKAVMAIFLNDRGEILIGSSPRDGGFKIPQGGLEVGETPVQGAIREVFEELGVAITEEDFYPPVTSEISYLFPEDEPLRGFYKGQRFHVFLIKYRDSMEPVPQDDEFDKLLWIKPSELDNFDTRHRGEAYRKALDLYGL